MAVATIDATSGGASANSYATQVEAIAYFEIRPGGNMFIDLGGEEQRATLLFAVRQIERETYWGRNDTTTQALKFPRAGQTAIPQQVKDAEFEQALYLANGGFLKQQAFIEAQSSGIREITAGDTRTRMIPSHTDGFASFQLAPQTRQLLSEFVESGARVGRA